MPDGDIFQRSLRGTGKGWTSLARLSAFNGTFVGLEGNVSRAFFHDVRRIPTSFIGQCLETLHKAFYAEASLSQEFTQRPDNLLILDQELRLIRSPNEFDLSNIFKDCVKFVFQTQRLNAKTISDGEISDSIGEDLICRVVDNRISRFRNELMNRSDLSASDQFVVEQKLKNEIRPAGRKFMKDFKAGKKPRSPVFRGPSRRSTADILNQPLRVFP